ncbi:MAG: YSIRK-type signal peptide-containing protein, partial [Lactobacillus delbrueckii]|nr:YSIRK-type signal peptide-containing protein [Lactobacillus delbrueckii]
MLSKNNRKLQERKLQEKQRFGFRKYSFGLASALIGVSFMLGTGSTVSADTTTPAENVAAATTSNTDSGAGAADATKSEATDTKSTDAAASTTDAATETKTDTNAAEASNTAAPSTTSETTETKSDSVTTNAAEASETKTSEANSEDKSSVTTNSNASADQSTSSASTAPAKAALARAASTTATTDDSISSEGKITDEGKAKGLTDSDVAPEMSDANGASLVADQSKIPSGYEADPADDRYTFGIVSLGPFTTSENITTYNGDKGTNYYFRFSTSKAVANSQYDDAVYAQLVDADTDTNKVIWESTLTVNGAPVKVDNLENVLKQDGSHHYYWLTYVATTTNGVTTKQIKVDSDVGTQYSEIIYDAANSSNTSSGTVVHVMYPDESTIRTEYIAKDADGNETMLADYEQIGRQGYTYTASGARIFKGYDLISEPSNTTGTLSASYKVGDIILSTQKQLSDQLQIARIYVITDTNGTAQVVLKVAALGASIDDIADESIWKTILTSNPVAPGGFADNGNYEANKENPKGAFLLYTLPKDGKQPIGVKYLTDAGFTEDQLTGYEKYLTIYGLNNRLAVGQEPVQYYYAPQGQVRINYVTSDGTVIQAPVSAYENSGANTSYDVTGSTYQPQTITANGKTYRYVKSDKSMGTAGTTEVNGYTYNVTPSDATGTIKSATVNDVYYVYEQVTFHTEAESKDVTRTIEYYDSVTGEPIPSNLESTVTQTAKLNRNKIYDDQNNFVGYGTISADGSSYTINDSWNVDKQTWTQQDSADLSDYGYTAPDRASVAAVTVNGDTTNVTEKVYYGHQTTPVTPDKPGEPGKPINPKGDVDYPDGVSKDDLTSTVKRTINYVDEDGNAVNGSPDGTSSYEQTAEFTRTAIVDKVTGKILGYDTDGDGKVDTESADRAWTPTKKTLEAVKSADPSSVGYDKVDIPNVSSLLVTPDQADTTVTVTYSNNPVIVSGTIKYVDDTTGAELDNDNLPSGEVGSKINYTTADKIKNYEDQGYELVSNDFADGTQTYAKEGNNFVVHLKHKTQTITPNDPNPVTPGEPINPNDPNSPVYGEETDRKNLVKDATQTIHYVGAGDKTPADNIVTQKDAFTRTVTIDKVTGKVLSYTDWTGEKTFNTVDTPVVQGYHADKKTAGGLTATVDNPDVEETVTYSPNGKLVPVDPNGTPIPGADTPTYPTDPNDPTKVVPNEPIPDVPDYTPVDPSPVTPEKPGEDTPVPYNQVVTGTIKYVDDTTGKTLSSEDLEKGTVGSKINYTTEDKIKSYEDKGYQLVSTDFSDGKEVYAKEGNDFVVHLKHATKEVVSYKDATQTIHYVGAGDKTPADKVQTQKDAFTKTDTIDKVTGEVVKTTGWEGTKTFGTENTPVVQGYHADKKTAGGMTATPENPDVEATVTYSPNGKLVPVDPNGTPIPGADTPTYPTDPNDPTKVVPNEPIPDVPGYTPVDPSPVTPTNPGEDTPVPYTKNETPEVKYGLTEKFVDEDGNELSPSVNKGTDYKTGDKYDVTK